MWTPRRVCYIVQCLHKEFCTPRCERGGGPGYLCYGSTIVLDFEFIVLKGRIAVSLLL